LLVAGGMECFGGDVVYRNSVTVLPIDDAEGDSRQVAFSLPWEGALGASLTTPRGVFMGGGKNENGWHRQAGFLRWSANERRVRFEELPNLPEALVYPSAALVRGRLYVAGVGLGGAGEGTLYWLELASLEEERKSRHPPAAWQKVDTLSLRGWEDRDWRVIVAGQNSGERQELFVFRASGEGVYSEGFRLAEGRGEQRWVTVQSPPRALLGSTAIAWGSSHILFFGGSAESEPGNIEAGIIQAYHPVTDTWADLGQMPDQARRVAVVDWPGGVLAFGLGDAVGHVDAGIYFGSIPPSQRWFGAPDFIVLFAYLGLLVAMGVYLSRANVNTSEYFLAGRRIPFWAAALSLMATSVSSIGFIAIPGKTFATDWIYFLGIITWFIVVPIVTIFYIPVLRKLNVTTAYEYLEHRFNLGVRLFGSLLFILMQLGRLAVVVYLPALVLSSVIQVDIYLCILLMGLISIVYTFLGGMAAVIWTDVIQSIVLFMGAILAVVVAVGGTEGGLMGLFEIVKSDEKMRLTEWRWDHTVAVVWVVVVGNIFTRFSNLTADQAIVQRYLTTKDTRQSIRALWGDVALSIPWAIVAFALGTALYGFYKSNPNLLVPGMGTDSVVPMFIAQQMPVGLAGLIIAAIFAAAMSSLDSSIHSLSTVCIRDFYGRLCSSSSEIRDFHGARGMTLLFGVIGTGGAMLIASYDILSIWDLFMGFMGLFVGSLSGLFLLGLFVPFSHSRGAILGAFTSAITVYFVLNHTALHFFLYPVVGVISCVIFGVIFSLILPKKKECKMITCDLTGENLCENNLDSSHRITKRNNRLTQNKE
jgi:SSS family transporter